MAPRPLAFLGVRAFCALFPGARVLKTSCPNRTRVGLTAALENSVVNLPSRIGFVILCWASLCCPAAAFEQIALRIGRQLVQAEVADSVEERAIGLSGRASLRSNHGMLFVFEQPTRPQFWMRDTSLALDIAFIESPDRITEIQPMRPGSERLHQPRKAVSYALEMPHGWYNKHAIRPGARVSGLPLFSSTGLVAPKAP